MVGLRSWRRKTAQRLLCILACLGLVGTAVASEYHGRVMFGSVPVPGAVVTLTQGTEQVSTITDSQGLYQFPQVADGAWKIHIEMHGFVTLDDSVTVAPNLPQGELELQLQSLEQMLAETHAAPVTPLELKPRATEAATPEKKVLNKSASVKANEAAPAAPKADDEAAERPSDGLLINGSVNNAATSPFTLSPAFGNRHPGLKSLYTGGFGLIYDNSVFDARPYSLSGLQVPKDSYNRVTALMTLGGPIRIPHLLYHGPNFFLAYQWTRNSDATTASGLVPTLAERTGDLSGLLNAQGQPATIYNPATGSPYVGAVPVSPQAAALLALYPLPNLAGNARYNYQTSLLNSAHEDALQTRLDKSIGRKDQFYGGFGLQSVRGNTINLFNFHDTENTLGFDTNVNWQHRYEHSIFVLLGYRLTRLRTEVRPQFENRQDVSGGAGITGNDRDPADWGPPNLYFSSITALSDANSEFNRNRTDNGSVKITNTHGRHTITVGGDFRRQEYNIFAQSNPRGAFTFTGAATSAMGSVSTTSGSDLADFLVGVPDTSTLAFGNADKYFRQSVYDAYATDDWRIMPQLTINAGFRWEYGAPLTELKGRLVNLDIAQAFSGATPVLGSSPKGVLTGSAYPSALVRADKRGFEPRVGISWRPIPASTLVIRAGYGIYDDTSIYLTSAQMMSQQAPLSTSLSVSNSAACPLTLANGFRNCVGTTPDNFAVDPDLHVGYAQVWQISAQRDLPAALVMTATYLGTKGTHGMQEFLPNTYPIGAANPCALCPIGFTYRTSGGNSIRESGSLQLRRRLRSGITATLQYTFAKDLDDDAQLGGQGHSISTSASSGTSTANTTGSPQIAQNWLNLRGERGPSTFDQRHLLNATFQYTSGMGLGGGSLLTGWRGRVLKEWTLLGRVTAGSGLPETPIYLAAVPDTGVTGTIRPNATGAPIYRKGGGYFLNSAAYAAPVAGQWGTAGRDSIEGPSQLSFDASMSRTFRLRDPFNLDVRLDATNLFNQGVFTSWNSTINSTTFGLPVAANPMRSVQITGRLRF
jgi:hypothetical protein